MGHSFTTYKGKSILSKDFKVQTWLYLICREIDKAEDIPEWVIEAKRHWMQEAEDCINGLINPEFDIFLNCEEKENFIIGICENIYNEFLSLGNKVPKSYLNELLKREQNDYDRIREDNDTEIYLNYGKALMDLLKGQQIDEIRNV